MRNRKMLTLAVAGLGVAAIIAVPVWAAGQNGNQMHMTIQVTMHMAGMPATPRTLERDFCMPAGKFDPEAMNRAMNKNTHNKCSVAHYSISGNVVTYDIKCEAPMDLVSHAVVHLTGNGGFTGKAHTTMSAEGQAMSMDDEYTATRTGSCTYTPPPSS